MLDRKELFYVGCATTAFGFVTLLSQMFTAYESFQEGRNIAIVFLAMIAVITLGYYFSQYMSQNRNGYYHQRDLWMGLIAAAIPTAMALMLLLMPVIYGAWIANSGQELP
jgi:TRAP-type C4-dicarboxylate transport system permease small subunit